MKRNIYIGLLILLSLTTCLAQKTETKLNISGKWSFDEKSSNIYALSPSLDEYVLDITQTDTEVKINRRIVIKGQTSMSETILYLDGRGEVNDNIKSKTVLKGNSIIRKKIGKDSGPDEKYSLSKDGGKLRMFRSRYTSGSPLLLSGNVMFMEEYFVFKR